MTPFKDIQDKTKVEVAVRRVDFALDGRVPWKRRKAIRDELRANLRMAAEAEGTDEALQQLGNLRELAASYLESERGALDIRMGCIASAIAFAFMNILSVMIFIAFRDGYRAGGGTSSWNYDYEIINGLGPFVGNGSSEKIFDIYFLSPSHVVILFATFIVASRSWRVITRRHIGAAGPQQSAQL